MKSILKRPAHYTYGFMSIMLAMAIVLTAPAYASTVKTLTHQVDVEQQQTLLLNSGVGVIELRHSEEPVIRMEVKLEGNRGGMLRRRTDVSGMDIKIDVDPERISLSFDEKNVNADWVIYLPRFANTQVKLGVGKIDGAYFSGDMSVSLGVGDVSLAINPSLLGNLQGSVGVGGIRVVDMDEFKSERRVVSEKVSGRGQGQYNLSIDVGVGDITVKAE